MVQTAIIAPASKDTASLMPLGQVFINNILQKSFVLANCNLNEGGDPAAPSSTATLLRLHSCYQPCLKRPPPEGWGNGFGPGQLQ